jgi:hypothetical protein
LLAGPGRGSAGGLLLAYVLGITHVDPLRYDLSADRFMTPDRIENGKLPDIDMDFGDRTPILSWLKTRFGDHCAQISTVSMMRLRSSIKDVHRVRDGRVSPEIEQICKKLPIPPQGVEDHDFVFGYKDADKNNVPGIIETDEVLKAYVKTYPEHWSIVVKALGLVRSRGRHACFPAGTLIYSPDGQPQEIEGCQTRTVMTATGELATASLVKQPELLEVSEFTLEDGTKITCTPDHRFLTNLGWVEIREIYALGLDIQTRF